MIPASSIARYMMITLALAATAVGARSQENPPSRPPPPPPSMRPRAAAVLDAVTNAVPATASPSLSGPRAPSAVPVPAPAAGAEPTPMPSPAPAAGGEPTAGSPGTPEESPAPDAPTPSDSAISLAPGERMVAPSAEPGEAKAVPIRLTEAPLDMVLRDYANLTGRTMIMAPGVTATITLESQTALTEAERRMALEAALAMNNISLVPLGDKFFKVVPSANARQEGLAVVTGAPEAERLPEGEAMTSQVITLKHLFKKTHDFITMRLFLHVDKVNNDNPAKITQSQLTYNDLCRLKIGFKYRIFERTSTHIGACIDINRGHRFSLINHQITTRLKINTSAQGFLNILFDVIELKQWLFTRIMI